MRRALGTNWNVCKVWAQQSQDTGYSGNVRFDDKTLYSYYAAIAHFIRPDVVLIDSGGYSNTTSGHTSLARGCVNGTAKAKQVFVVPHILPKPEQHTLNIKYYLAELRRTMHKYNNARTWALNWLNWNNGLYDELTKYCKTFNLKMPLTLGLYLNREYSFIKRRIWKTTAGNQVFIPKSLADKVEERGLQPRDMLTTKNAEVRREIVARVGIERICHSLHAEVVDKVGDYELLLLDLRDGRKRPFLKMLNPSVPEIWHIEGVHPACKTVQDALNYRRYGRDLLEPIARNWGLSLTELRAQLAETPLKEVDNWNPEITT